MARLLLILTLIVFALPATALDHTLSSQAPPKPTSVIVPPPAAPEVIRQGGDTILDAVMVVLPVAESGTTTGYNHDYDEECPYSGSTAPDVVYTFVAPDDMQVNVDLFGSTYDTKVFVYDENLALVACNDDFYSDYVSKIEAMPITSGVQYFVVIDGYSGAFGDYVLNIIEFIPPPPCIIECPSSGVMENEPPLEHNYADAWNGGCNSPEFGNPFQPLTAWFFCGVSGFFTTDAGNSRDTDWFTVTFPVGGVIGIVGDAEVETYMFELGPQDCGSVGVIQNVIIGPCAEGTITIGGAPGSTAWFWVGPTDFYAPDGSDLFEYDYLLIFDHGGCVTEEQCWSGVKALFR